MNKSRNSFTTAFLFMQAMTGGDIDSFIDEIDCDKELKQSDVPVEEATVKEMTDHCDRYACRDCPISFKCSMFRSIFGYNPKKENHNEHD